MRPDAVYLNGTVFQMDESCAVAEAFAIQDGRFVAVGTTSEIRRLKTAETKEFDLQGYAVLPGFNDTHNHALYTGLDMAKVQLGQARSLDDVLTAIKRQSETKEPGEWIVCSSAWHESQLLEKRLPTRAELDAVAPRHPVFLPRGAHTLMVNSMALERSGIDRHTQNPDGGEIKKDPRTGEPTGLLFEPPAIGLVQKHIPKPTRQQKEEALRRVVAAYVAAGITSLIEPGLSEDEIELYRGLRQEQELPIRVSAMVGLGFFHWPSATVDNVRALGVYAEPYDPVFRVDGIKLFVDGGVETAWLRQPYCIVPGEQEDPQFTGVPVLDPMQMQEMVLLAHQNNWRVGIHAVGDAAIGVVLNVFARVDHQKPIRDKRFMLIHAILAAPEHMILMRQLGVVVTLQVHTYALGGNMIRYWGRERAARANPVKQFIEHGVPVAGGTDSMVCPYNQLLAVWSHISRSTRQGEPLDPTLSLTREQAFKLHTAWGSYVTFEEHVKGTIEVGRYADFVVLSHNPFTCPLEEIKDVRVLQTVMGGRTVYQA
ncbi:MAG: amidohydrolase [Acidobacteriota bacterium]|nr:amidohydrolase [Acidobacteriota bacterium]